LLWIENPTVGVDKTPFTLKLSPPPETVHVTLALSPSTATFAFGLQPAMLVSQLIV
jgi:hypothetical protein